MDYRAAAIEAANRNGVPPDLFLRVVQQESSWNPGARSPAGALGLAQLMPGTARDLGVDPNDPLQNLEGGARYLAQQLKTFGDPELALAAYNAGPGAVKKHGGVPPYAETQNYVAKIMGQGGGSNALQAGGWSSDGWSDSAQWSGAVPDAQPPLPTNALATLMQQPSAPPRVSLPRLDPEMFMNRARFG